MNKKRLLSAVRYFRRKMQAAGRINGNRETRNYKKLYGIGAKEK